MTEQPNYFVLLNAGFEHMAHDPVSKNAILDWIFYASHRIELTGESLRKNKMKKTQIKYFFWPRTHSFFVWHSTTETSGTITPRYQTLPVREHFHEIRHLSYNCQQLRTILRILIMMHRLLLRLPFQHRLLNHKLHR
ncbi:hypothetical protein [Mangrovibacterium sp.]|uniref:hypothetical protein n=1 Tax=Mangrovibacterium sp. TaxID=1961364 RepID=UPI0035648E27